MSYKHGIYTENVATGGRLGVKSIGTVPVYVGAAPIHMTGETTDKTNTPILINSFNDFMSVFGYSDNWGVFTLCEVAYAHFKNDIQSVAPIVVINIFDPAVGMEDTKETVSVTFINNIGYIDDTNNDIIASTLECAEIDNFTAEYTGGNKIKITCSKNVSNGTFTYNKVSVAKNIINTIDNSLDAIDLTPIKCGVVPNIIVCPKLGSEIPLVRDKLISKCESRIDNKWGCVAYIDIPANSNKTIAEAISYKSDNAITSKYVRLHYPKVKHNGRTFHLSVLDAVATQLADLETDGVACRSSSNRRTMCDVPVVGTKVAQSNLVYSESDANQLNANGITTVNYIGGSFRLWGGHMANYDHSKLSEIDANDRSDATVRMQIFLENWLKSKHIDNIDAPLTRRDIDNIVASVNIGLNSFVNSGYLLKGECYFDGGNNSTGELADGNLVLDVTHTEVPNGKSINFKLQYDTDGLKSLYETEEV